VTGVGAAGLGTRISVVGNSGTGKTTMAAALAATLGLKHVELDAIYHQPGWQALSTGAFRHRTRQALGGDGWVVDGNYRSVLGDVVWARADTVVWLDFPLSVALPRIAARTARRARTGELICNGNVETWANFWRRGGIVRWALTAHAKYRRRYHQAATDPHWAHLRFVRLQSPAQAAALLASLSG
jgi:adenylate kinase family enzyme